MEIKDHLVKAHPVPGALSTSSAKLFNGVAKCKLALKSVAVQRSGLACAEVLC